jgi:hypothetical protein
LPTPEARARTTDAGPRDVSACSTAASYSRRATSCHSTFPVGSRPPGRRIGDPFAIKTETIRPSACKPARINAGRKRRWLSNAARSPAKMSNQLLRPDLRGRHSFPAWTAAPLSTGSPRPTRPRCACRTKAMTPRPLPSGSAWPRPRSARYSGSQRRSSRACSAGKRKARDSPRPTTHPALKGLIQDAETERIATGSADS